MPAFTYFAYGSNMHTARLRERVGYCVPQGVAKLAGYVLRFHKRSDRDGTGKCNALYTGDLTDFVMGVLFEIAQERRAALDRFEGAGKGYDAAQVEVSAGAGTVPALTYLASATHIDDQLRPTPEYFAHVLAGAHEHGLPEAYITSQIAAFAPGSGPTDFAEYSPLSSPQVHQNTK